MTSSEKKSSASIAVYLASNGADLHVRNRKNQTPLDLCPDPSLLKLLTKSSHDYAASQKGATNHISQEGEGSESLTECMVCSESSRDTLFAPCGHVAACSVCAARVKKCLICKEPVTSRTKVGELVLIMGLTVRSVMYIGSFLEPKFRPSGSCEGKW